MSILFLLLAAPLLAEEPPPPTEKPAPAYMAASGNTRAIFPIDPKGRANDLIQAFDLLRKEKPTLKITLRTMSGMVFTNVSEVSAAANGTILFIKYLSNQGTKTQMVLIEEILEVSYS